MTTNQTIDGVPRELAERFAQYAESGKVAEPGMVEELRALLDAPSVETVGLTAWQKGRDAMRDERDYWMEKCTKGGNPVYQAMSLTDGQGWHDVTVERYQVAKSAPDFNKVRILYDVPAAQPQGEPVAYLDLEKIQPAGMAYATKMRVNHRQTALYAEQPAPVAVVLPERLPGDDGVCTESHYASGWNDCLGEVTRLNSTRPTHANPPPGTEPSGTHHDNDGLDEWRKP